MSVGSELLAAREAAGLSLEQVAEPRVLQDALQVVLVLPLVSHVRLAVGVYHLVAQSPDAEVRSLR